MEEHHFQENYSGRNPVPTVQKYEANLLAQNTGANPDEVPKTTSDVTSDDVNKSYTMDSIKTSPGPHRAVNETHDDDVDKPVRKTDDATDGKMSEKDDIMERMSRSKENPTKALKLHGERTVKDPVTGSEVVISDAKSDPKDGDYFFGFIPILQSYSSPEQNAERGTFFLYENVSYVPCERLRSSRKEILSESCHNK
ncbi:hypothetical protein DFH28DRAFT_1161339 [Melampsora americana]|nr:hypothetical protein DFH28DRAFT_1161339 [Melampsora americana]